MGLFSYVRKVWKGGDAVTPSTMNNIETGIEELCNKVTDIDDTIGKGDIVFGVEEEPVSVLPPHDADTLGGIAARLFAKLSDLNLGIIENSRWKKETVGEVVNEINSDLTKIKTLVGLGDALTPLNTNTSVTITLSERYQNFLGLYIEYGYGYGATYPLTIYGSQYHIPIIPNCFRVDFIDDTHIKVTSTGINGASGADDKIRVYGLIKK